MLRALVIVVISHLFACGGNPQDSRPSSQSTSATIAATPAPAASLEFIPGAPTGPVDDYVKEQLKNTTNRPVVVYVGATWCEPCKRFHDSVQSGELAGVLPPILFIEYDLDKDKERLVSAGYQSKMIPLFAKPNPDGTSSGKQIEGSIKGPGATMQIVPRLKNLLDIRP